MTTTEFTIHATIAAPYEVALARVREELANVGFGVLTEIDLAATLRAKLDVEIPPTMILGACRPQLAYQAIQADPRIAALLPCNVVVTATGEASSLVEAFDPVAMTAFAGDDDLSAVAGDARGRLAQMIAAVAVEIPWAAEPR